MATLTLEGLSKYFGAVRALDAVDLDVADGEFIVLVGPSGCGKSTLLRCIAGLEKITDGDIRVNGRPIARMPTRDRNMAMVFQSYALFPHLTVADNISFGLKLRRTDSNVVVRKVAATASLLGLSELTGRYPRQLSGGQRQRVAMGRAIVRDPDLFLFDEPLSNLDAKLRVQMRTEIKSLRQRLGITSIYVTHDQDEAMTLADRIVVMNGGRIEQIGTPMELYDHPKNLFVAGFMGSPTMNFIPVFRSDEGEWTHATPDGQKLSLPRLTQGGPDSVIIGLRPEEMTIGDGGALKGTVDVVEPRGPDTLVFVRIGETALVCVATEKRTMLRPGDAVGICFDPRKAHFFGSSDGQSVSLASN